MFIMKRGKECCAFFYELFCFFGRDVFSSFILVENLKIRNENQLS